jgi:hypothetical protein
MQLIVIILLSFNEGINNWYYLASNDWMTMNNEQKGV